VPPRASVEGIPTIVVDPGGEETVVSVESATDLRGVQLALKTTGTPEKSGLANLEMPHYESNGIVSVGILDLDGTTTIASGRTELFRIFGEVEVTEALVSDMKHRALQPQIKQLAKGELLPEQFSLSQNYPNPFNPSTKISFSVAERMDYTLTIYNVAGQTVHTFSGMAEAGDNTVQWDASGCASGVYLYRLETGSFSATRKMVLLK
jgi:hypothetical protein